MAAQPQPEHRKAVIQAAKDQLFKESKKLLDLVRPLHSAIPTVDPHGDPMDHQFAAEETSLATSEREMATVHVQRIEEALTAVADGWYGTCIDCGNDIPNGRISAVYWAIRCVPCQEQLEGEPPTIRKTLLLYKGNRLYNGPQS